MTLREFAIQEMEAFWKQEEMDPPKNREDLEDRIDRWVRDLLICGIPDDILAAMPEISRHNEPCDSPQEFNCGCISVTRITDRDYRYKQEPFEMRLAVSCDGTNCVRHVSLLDFSVAEALRDAELLDAEALKDADL